MTVEFVILPDLFEINSDKWEKDMWENGIPSTSSLPYVAKISHKAKFMRITGFVCKHPCRMSCENREHIRLGRLVKNISFWYV